MLWLTTTSGWSPIQLLLSTTTWSTRSSSSQPALSIRLVAHPAVVVNHNMEYKIIIFSTSSLHQVGRPSTCCCQPQHGVQDHLLKQGGACGVFPQEFEFVIQNLTPERRLWWPN